MIEQSIGMILNIIHKTKAAIVVALTLLAVMAINGALQAQQDAAAPTPEISADQVNAVARELWCPLCSGVRLDSCELKACEQMREVIAIKLAAGEDTESIKTYFFQQYGPQVLGEPPREGFNWLAWILPFAGLIGGGVYLWLRARRMMVPAAPVAAATMSQSSEDALKRKLDEELKRYG